MGAIELYLLQIAFFSVVPLYLGTLPSLIRLIAFSIYLGLLLFLGGLFGAAVSFSLADGIEIPGGTISYAALLMATMMLVLVENQIAVVKQVIRLVITVNIFQLMFFAILIVTLNSGLVTNPMGISVPILATSAKVVVVGGVLVVGEMLLLLLVFERIKQHMRAPLPLAAIFTACFSGVLLLDGLLFPLLFGLFEAGQSGGVFAGVRSKVVLAVSFMPAMFAFMVLFRGRIRYFVEEPLALVDLVHAKNDELRQEITRQRRNLAIGEARFLELAESMDDVFFTLDGDLRFTYWNKSSEILGFQSDQVLGKTFGEVFPYKRTSGEVKKYRTALFERSSQVFEARYFVGGVWLTYEVSASGRHRGVTVVARDITERLLLENGLRESQKLEALGTLAGGIAHDLNNSLNIINGYIELSLLKSPPESEISGYLRNINTVKDRAAGMVKQILSFSRMDTVRFEVLDPVELVKETVELLRAVIPSEVEFVVNLPRDCGRIRADKTQLNQVLVNLVTNGYHAMDGAGGVLTVAMEQVAVNDCPLTDLGRQPDQVLERCLKISISDTGAGIGPDNLQRIFDPFFTTKEVGQGTGLGLSVVQGIIKRHQGEVRVSSELGRGSVFTLFLPLVETVETEGYVEELDLYYKASNAHLLIVEDDAETRALYKTFLEPLGYSLTLCADGLEALKKFESNPDIYQLVFTDLDMPRMDGKRLIQELRRIRPELPVVVATGHSANFGVEEAASYGVRHYLAKPINLNAMLAAIEDSLARTGRAGTLNGLARRV